MRDSLGDSFEKIIGQNLVVPKLYAIGGKCDGHALFRVLTSTTRRPMPSHRPIPFPAIQLL